MRILFHTVCLRISRLTRGRLECSVFNISPKQTLRGPLEFCPCKVSLVLCQITGFSLYLCQFQIKTRSPIDTSTESKLANAHRECDPSACTTTTSALIPHGLYFLYLLDLPGIPFRFLCTENEGNVTKSFVASIY